MCDRFEKEAFSGFGITDELKAHLATCDDCQKVAARYDRLEKLIAVSHAHAMPKAGWEARLQQRIARTDQGVILTPGIGLGKGRWGQTAAVAGLVLAASIAVIVLKPSGTVGPNGAGEAVASLELTTTITKGTATRADSASVGDRYTITGTAGEEVRVWFNSKELVGRCPIAGNTVSNPDGVSCTVADGKQTLVVPFKAPGEYRVMALKLPGEGRGSLAAPVSFDDDARLARQQSANYRVLEPVSVF